MCFSLPTQTHIKNFYSTTKRENIFKPSSLDILNKNVFRQDTGISSLATTVTSSHSSEFNTLVASVSSDSGIQFGKLSEMSNSAGDVSKSTSDSEKSPKQEIPVEAVPKSEVFKDVDDEVTDKIEIIEKIAETESVVEKSVKDEEKCDENDKAKENTEKVPSSLKRTNSVKARANLFQELEKKQKEIEKPVLQKPKRGIFFSNLCKIK